MTLARWFGERVPVSAGTLRELTNEPVPYHLKRWWFALGGTPAYLFVVQIVTGILLAFYYEASTATAYDSVRFITDEAAYGWYLRSVHKWAATLMIAAVVLHQMRVFFTGAYRKPRELNWIVGMFILLCTLMLGFTGYSLVFEQLSFWGATVGANIADTLPMAGGFLKNMLLAGETYNDHTLARFFVIHAAVLPAVLVGLIAVHVALVRLQGVTDLRFEHDDADQPATFNFFPDHLLYRVDHRPGADDPAQHAGHDPARHARAAGRPARHAGRHQAGVVLLRRLSLAQAVQRHHRGAESRLHRLHHVRLAVHRRLDPAPHPLHGGQCVDRRRRGHRACRADRLGGARRTLRKPQRKGARSCRLKPSVS